MTFMNQYQIEEAVARFAEGTVLGTAARFLNAFKDEVNAHSDGWAYWNAPVHASAKLQNFVHSHLYAGMGAYPRLPEPTMAQFQKTLAPIRSFYTRRGNAAGMSFPEVKK